MEKAELICEDKRSMSVVLQFNPTSFQLARKVNWAEQSPALQPYTLLQYGNGASDTLQVSLLLDTTESSESILPGIRKLYDLTLPTVSVASLSLRPPLVSFVWQAFRFSGVVQSMDFEVLTFDTEGHPKRATVALGLLGQAFPSSQNPFDFFSP